MRIYADTAASTMPADPERFTGAVWRTNYVDPEASGGLSGQRFAYAPGARSFWHIHTANQALIVLTGRGVISWQGLAEPRSIAEGDWVYVEPGVRHWHGADPTSLFVHLAVTAGGDTQWLGPVSDAEARGAVPLGG